MIAQCLKAFPLACHRKVVNDGEKGISYENQKWKKIVTRSKITINNSIETKSKKFKCSSLVGFKCIFYYDLEAG